jgi:hypothetical protein
MPQPRPTLWQLTVAEVAVAVVVEAVAVVVTAAEVVSEVAAGLRAPPMVLGAVVREAAGTVAARDP